MLHKALHILDLFDGERPSWSQAELMRETGVAKSTVSRVVRYLCDRRYLTLLQPHGRYALGPAAIDLGRRASAQIDLRQFARASLDRLAHDTGETAMLVTLSPDLSAVVCVDQSSYLSGGLQVFQPVGSTFPLYAGASSKAVLAYLPPAVRDRVLRGPLPAVTAKTQTDTDRIARELRRQLDRGYAVSREETHLGVAGVAAPFFGANGAVLGSLAVAAPMQRFGPKPLAYAGEQVAEAAARLSEDLGASVTPPASIAD